MPLPYKLMGLDIETACNVEGCDGKGCEHALDFNRNRITVIAISDGESEEHIFRGGEKEIISSFIFFVVNNPNNYFTAHNGKFDFENIIKRSPKSREPLLRRWTDDSCLLAFTHQDKITDSWLEKYELERQAQNKKRTGHMHREAGKHSLKTLAPYYLGVEPFWEPESGHDDDEYVLTDTRYCLQLTKYLLEKLPAKSLEFYHNNQLEWSKMLLDMELKGIVLDDRLLADMWRKDEQRMFAAEAATKEQWSKYFEEWRNVSKWEIEEKYHAMEVVNVAKGRFSEKQRARHYVNRDKALAKIEDLNLNAPQQLLWLLRDQLGLDTRNLDGDISTDAEVLTRLSVENKEVGVLLEYRETKKLCSTYYPKYKEVAYKGRIHCNFRDTTARTGRLSCSNPNLQQVPGALHALFVADPGYLLINRDLSAVEPTVVAYFSEDPVLCELIITGGDFHGTTAVAAFDLDCKANEVKAKYKKLRDVAKTIGLAVLYGAGAYRVWSTLQAEGITHISLEQCKIIVKKIRDKYKGVWEFKQQLDRELETGATLYNLLGRPMRIENRDDVYMKGFNRLIQSSASDLMLEGALNIKRNTQIEGLLLVHDELICQAPEAGILESEKRAVHWLQQRPLPTKYGNIPIRTEGKISTFWEK